MSAVCRLLDELAVIGATVQPSGKQLVLRAGPKAIPAELVRRVRAAKGDIMAALTGPGDAASPAVANRKPRSPMPWRLDTDTASSNRIVEWLNQHPVPSPSGRCAWCGTPESMTAAVLPFGIEPGTHTWLHAECWVAWHQAREDEARRDLSG